MKSSTRFDSLGSIQSSGLNAPSPSRGTGMAILQGRSETSNFSILRAADSPFRIRFQVVSTPHPSGDTMPKPVTTTRLMPMLSPTINRRPPINYRPVGPQARTGRRERQLSPRPAIYIRRSGLCVRLNELDRVLHREDLLGRVVRNLHAEFFFERHHQLDVVEAVGAQIIDEAGALGDLVRVDAKMLDDDLLQAFSDITHFKSSDLWF